MVSDHHGLLAVGQIDPDDRVLRRQQLPHPRQPQVAVAISPGQAGTVTHGRPPRCVGYQARQPHQEDVSTSSTDALRGVTSGWPTLSVQLRRIDDPYIDRGTGRLTWTWQPLGGHQAVHSVICWLRYTPER